jgi:hypothetical protein
MSKVLEQLKGDPAKLDLQIQTIYGSAVLHREFPTNWIAPAVMTSTNK